MGFGPQSLVAFRRVYAVVVEPTQLVGDKPVVCYLKGNGSKLRVATPAFVEQLGDDNALKSRALARALIFVALEPSLVGSSEDQ